MSERTLNLNGQTFVVETGRPLSGGVSGTKFGDFLANVVSVTAPNVVVANIAANGTSNLNTRFNTLRTTSDGTIANAVINMPTGPTDGEVVTVSITGAISNVTGTISNSSITVPAITSTAASFSRSFRYNATASLWIIA